MVVITGQSTQIKSSTRYIEEFSIVQVVGIVVLKQWIYVPTIYVCLANSSSSSTTAVVAAAAAAEENVRQETFVRADPTKPKKKVDLVN